MQKTIVPCLIFVPCFIAFMLRILGSSITHQTDRLLSLRRDLGHFHTVVRMVLPQNLHQARLAGAVVRHARVLAVMHMELGGLHRLCFGTVSRLPAADIPNCFVRRNMPYPARRTASGMAAVAQPPHSGLVLPRRTGFL